LASSLIPALVDFAQFRHLAAMSRHFPIIHDFVRSMWTFSELTLGSIRLTSSHVFDRLQLTSGELFDTVLAVLKV